MNTLNSRDNGVRIMLRIAVFVFSAAATTTVSGAARADSSWNCFRNDGRLMSRITIWWGNTPTDASWACNQWISDCNGSCMASGCDLSQRVDGCSIPLNDPTSNAYKNIFRNACNAHDVCYHAPWDRISDYWSGFNRCNDNFWNDMNSICDSGAVDWATCRVVASVWADAMNFDPLRTKFSDSFANDQAWMRSNCQR